MPLKKTKIQKKNASRMPIISAQHGVLLERNTGNPSLRN
jgi:hypothetical protein